MIKKRIVSTPEAPAAIGPYSQAVVALGLVHCSGQIALDPQSGELVGSDVETQARQVFKNLRAVLAAAGASTDSVLKCNVFLADMGDFPRVNALYEQVFDGPQPPARATVAVKTLPKNALIEIDCVALVDE